jgi:hypothetical protein
MRRLLTFWPIGILPLAVAAALAAIFGSSVDLKITQAQQDLSVLDTALHIYKSRHGDFPSEADGLATLTGDGGPLQYPAKDPWGNSYVYRHRVGTDSYFVYSLGLDHRDDRGAGDDVVLSSKSYRCTDYGVNCPPTVGQVGAWAVLALAVASLVVGVVRTGAALSHPRRPNNRWRGS